MGRPDLGPGGQIVGHTLSHSNLATTCGAHAQGKKRCLEACASEDDSEEMDVVHTEGFHGGMVVALGVKSHRKSGSSYLHSGKGCECHWKE